MVSAVLENTPRHSSRLSKSSHLALASSVKAWFVTAVAGQWIFIFYLLAYYVHPALLEGLEAWSNYSLATGYIPGDTLGNAAVATHIFLALIVMGGGSFQFIPWIRSRFPSFHRWNGRIYMAAAVLTSLAGLYMVWIRGNPQAGVIEHIGTSAGAVLIVLFAALALRDGMARDIRSHRRWALRLFMVVSGVWFIRIGYGLWFLFQDGAAGNSRAFSVFISFAQYLIPLAVLELYLYVQARFAARGRFAMAVLLVALTALTGVGIYQAFTVLWLPRL